MRILHELGTNLEAGQNGCVNPLWRYVYGGKPKPFFHPLCTPAGHLLSLFEPHDHTWHRGLWFTIKFINGGNFWEEKEGEGWGVQRTLRPPLVMPIDEARLAVYSRQSWIGPAEMGEVISERRAFEFLPLGEQAYAIDLRFSLRAAAPLLLDRTPYTTWGGYGGLTFRGNRNWQETRLLFSDGTMSDRPLGVRALWCDLSGKFDGGAHATGGIAIMDHPSNPRHPTPWYGGTGPGHYFNAAFLFHEPMNVERGQTLEFRYRALIHDGIWEHARLQDAYEQYAARAGKSALDDQRAWELP